MAGRARIMWPGIVEAISSRSSRHTAPTTVLILGCSDLGTPPKNLVQIRDYLSQSCPSSPFFSGLTHLRSQWSRGCSISTDRPQVRRTVSNWVVLPRVRDYEAG